MEQRRRRDLLVAGIALAAFPASGAGKKAKEDQQFEEKEHELLRRTVSRRPSPRWRSWKGASPFLILRSLPLDE